MEGLELIEPTELYNFLNLSTGQPFITNPNYLLLLDARNNADYSESHILTAKAAPKNDKEYLVPYDAELMCKQHIIVYDSNTTNLKENGEAVACAKVMWKMGSRTTVKVLKGGYEDFSAYYPFLRVKKIIYMPRELDEIKTYPLEIIPGYLYLGNWRQGNAAYMQKDLKIKGHINCCVEPESFFREEGENLVHIAVEDSDETDIYSKFQTACDFIDKHKSTGNSVLVFSKLGISRSVTIVIAYLMHHSKLNLKDAFNHVLKCCPYAKLNQGFIYQLSKWEEDILGEKTTDVDHIN